MYGTGDGEESGTLSPVQLEVQRDLHGRPKSFVRPGSDGLRLSPPSSFHTNDTRYVSMPTRAVMCMGAGSVMRMHWYGEPH